jgi:hypothetical protein
VTSCAVREGVDRDGQRENKRAAVRDNSGMCEAERTTNEMWMWKSENKGNGGTTRMKDMITDSGNDESGRKTRKVRHTGGKGVFTQQEN